MSKPTNVALVTKLLAKKNLNSMFNIVSSMIDFKVIYIESWINSSKTSIMLGKAYALDLFMLVATQKN